MSDRTVHAATADGGEVVRYDRAGKWFLEYPPGADGKYRRQLTLKGAVGLATERGATAFVGKPGGGAFDRAVHLAWRSEILR